MTGFSDDVTRMLAEARAVATRLREQAEKATSAAWFHGDAMVSTGGVYPMRTHKQVVLAAARILDDLADLSDRLAEAEAKVRAENFLIRRSSLGDVDVRGLRAAGFVMIAGQIEEQDADRAALSGGDT
jgi:hypothetical protein